MEFSESSLIHHLKTAQRRYLKDIEFLENLRFQAGESNIPQLKKQVAWITWAVGEIEEGRIQFTTYDKSDISG